MFTLSNFRFGILSHRKHRRCHIKTHRISRKTYVFLCEIFYAFYVINGVKSQIENCWFILRGPRNLSFKFESDENIHFILTRYPKF
jgi:hypothetical protein